MLTGLQKAKALKELKQLRQDKARQTGLALAKTLKRMKELRTDLGMGQQNNTQPESFTKPREMTEEEANAIYQKQLGQINKANQENQAKYEAKTQAEQAQKNKDFGMVMQWAESKGYKPFQTEKLITNLSKKSRYGEWGVMTLNAFVEKVIATGGYAKQSYDQIKKKDFYEAIINPSIMPDADKYFWYLNKTAFDYANYLTSIGYGKSDESNHDGGNEKFLSTTEPVIALTGKEFGEFEDTPDGLKALREASIQYLDNLRETQENIFCSAVNADVLLDKTGIKKIKSFSSNRIKLKALFAIKDLIKNATLVKANQESYDNEEKKRGITYSIIKTPIVIDGVEYGTRMVLRKLPDGTYHYDLQIKDNVNVIFDSINDSQKNSDKGGSAKESDVLYRLAESYQNNSNHVKLMFDKATIDVNNMVLNLFIFDKDGNEIADDSTDTTIGSDTSNEPTELAQLLTDLQEERILPNDIDLDHLAELAANSDENDTLDQIRNILDMELVAKWQQQLDEMAA